MELPSGHSILVAAAARAESTAAAAAEVAALLEAGAGPERAPGAGQAPRGCSGRPYDP